MVTAPVRLRSPSPGKTFTLSHVYTDNGTYTVTAVITDDDGGVGVDTLLVGVGNVIPAVNAGPDQATSEGTSSSWLRPATDVGLADTHTATINWGDGTAARWARLPKQQAPALSPVTTGGDNGNLHSDRRRRRPRRWRGLGHLTVTVSNVNPVVEAGGNRTTTGEGTLISLAPSTFTDVGSADTHTAAINWGDGTIESGTVTQGAGSGSVAGSHVTRTTARPPTPPP